MSNRNSSFANKPSDNRATNCGRGSAISAKVTTGLLARVVGEFSTSPHWWRFAVARAPRVSLLKLNVRTSVKILNAIGYSTRVAVMS